MMLNKESPQVQPDAIPSELKALPNWVMWKYIPSEKKPRKVPYTVHNTPAKSNDSSSWCTFDQVMDCYYENGHEYAGVGFMFNNTGLVGIDLDNCLHNAKLTPFAKNVMATVQGYAEISPSGTGLHIIARANISRSYKTEEIEIYKTGRYFTMTGITYQNNCAITDTPQDLTQFIKSNVTYLSVEHDPLFVKPSLNVSLDHIRTTVNRLDPDMAESNWTNVIWGVHHETHGSDEGFEIVSDWSALGLKYDPYALRSRWLRSNDTHNDAFTFKSIEKMARALPTPKAQHATADDPIPQYIGNDYLKGYASQSWLIKRFLPKAEFGVVFGASGSGKTFFVLDIAAKLAANNGWRDRKTLSNSVLYVASEAREGVKKRLQGYVTANSELSNNLRIQDFAPNLLNLEHINMMITSTLLRPDTSLIIFDTLAASHNGDENSATDMTAVIANCRYISLKTNAMVLLVHHTGKNTNNGMRGSNSLESGADVVIEVTYDKTNGERKATVTKQKDGELGDPYYFKLKVVDLGTDIDGDAITTCVIENTFDLPVAKEDTEAVIATKETILNVFDIRCADMVGEQSLDVKDFIADIQAYLLRTNKKAPKLFNIERTIALLCGAKGALLMVNGRVKRSF